MACLERSPKAGGGRFRNRRKSGDHPDYYIKISQNTEQSSGDLWRLTISHTVTYWPSTEPSIKRCTCVNKWKNSRNRWMSDNYITRCPRRFELVGVEVSWRQDAELRASGRQRALDPQWPMVEQPSQDKEEVLLWSKEELWVKITVYTFLQLIPHTQETSPFRE